MKVEREVTFYRSEMSMMRWMYGLMWKERKNNTELRENLFGLEPVSLDIKRGRLRWFRHVEHKDDADWVNRCIVMEVEETRRGRPKKTYNKGI